MLATVATTALMPFLAANAEDPVAAWIALALMLAMTLRTAAVGLFPQAIHVERVTLGSSGVLVTYSKLAHIGAVYQQVEVVVGWGEVQSIEINDRGDKADRGAVVEIALEAASVWRQEVRLVYANRGKAVGFVTRAMALRAAAMAA